MNCTEIRNLTKFYGRARGIEDVSLNLKQGDFLGFIGPNGAGKSTLIRTMLGYLQSQAGTIRIFGLDLKKNRQQILARTGYLPSESVFYPDMKVSQLLRYAARMRNKDCSEQAKMLCRRLGLDPDKKIRELSLGNRKKLGIVCALQHEPELLILDEPTSGLDPLIQKEFFEILHELNRKGVTILLSSHQLSEIQNHCSRAVLIREGRIIAVDALGTLLHTRSRRIRIESSAELPLLPGMHSLCRQNGGTSFLYDGDLNELLKALLHIPLQDLCIEEPDLEELFLHLYETEPVSAERSEEHDHLAA